MGNFYMTFSRYSTHSSVKIMKSLFYVVKNSLIFYVIFLSVRQAVYD